MSNEDWQKPEIKTTRAILDEINPRLAPLPFASETTTLRTHALPFYREHVLVELTDLSTVPAARKYALYRPGDVNVLNWTNQPIYDTNEKAPVIITAETVAPYVRFFFGYVRGRHGRFVPVETVEDIRWQAEPPLQGRKAMQDLISPLAIQHQDDRGVFYLKGFMLFKDSLFKTGIQVTKDGSVTMSDEELCVEGMPILQDAGP